MIQLIILDWDDTIMLHATRAYLKCYEKGLQSVGVQLSPKEMMKRIERSAGKGMDMSTRTLLQEYPEKIKDCLKVVEESYGSEIFRDEVSIVPGALEAMSFLAEKYKLAVVSGQESHVLQQLMVHFAIPDIFCRVLCMSDIVDKTKVKPHPFAIEQILRQTGCAKENTVMVGDSPNDIMMGKNAGVKTVAVLTGFFTLETAQKSGADIVIDTVSNLPETLDKL